jgi:peroxiredoxin
MSSTGTPTHVPTRRLHTVGGGTITLPDPDVLTHLQFRRFAGCPICNVHLQSFVRRHHEVEAHGIREVVFFHSSAAELSVHTEGLPFTVIADPDKRYYREFGVESGPRALLDPRAWGGIVRGVAATLSGRFRAPALSPEGGRLGLPADFLIDPGGVVLAAKHGRHADDQWSVDDLLATARAARRTTA